MAKSFTQNKTAVHHYTTAPKSQTCPPYDCEDRSQRQIAVLSVSREQQLLDDELHASNGKLQKGHKFHGKLEQELQGCNPLQQQVLKR